MMNTNNTTTTDTSPLSFDPIVLVVDVIKRWLLIVVIAITMSIGTYIFMDLSYKPLYQSTTTFVVTTQGSTTIFSNLSSTTSVASVFTELLNSSILHKSILEELGTESFDGTISASAVAETNLLNVSVTASDPRTAFLVSQAIIEHHEEITYQVVDGVTLEVLLSPKVPYAPINRTSPAGQMKKMAIFSAIAAMAAIAFISYYQDKIRSSREVRAKLDCSHLGEIPHETKHRTLASWLSRQKTSILITSPVTSFRFIETIRKLRRRIEHRMRSGKVLMVTSLMENEGKSTVAVNLALAMAQKKDRVLLVDCDLRKPACFQLLEYRKFDHTVTDVINGVADPQQAVYLDKKSNLHLMLENRGHGRSGDLIGSEGMHRLLQWARENYDFIILDLPPMAEVSDAETMTKFADASLLVVRQNLAPAPAVRKAVESLEKGHAKLLGCVLNNVYSTALSSGQGYGYGYGYGKYGKYGHYGHYHTNSGSKN